MKIDLRKWIFLVTKNIFSWILISKMDVKMNSRIVTKIMLLIQKKGFSQNFKAIWPCRQRGSTLISLQVFTCSWKLGKCLWTQSRTFSRNRSILGNPGVRHPFIRILSILFSSLAQSARAFFITHQMTQNYDSSKWHIFLSQYLGKILGNSEKGQS